MKLLNILNEVIKDFKTYSDARDYIKSQVKLHGQRYYTTDDYKSIYPLVQKLYDIESNKYKDKKKQEIENNNIKPGDKILITWANMWGQSDSIEGTLFMRSGIPYVKLPYKMPIGVNGKIVYKQSIPFSSKNMKKIE